MIKLRDMLESDIENYVKWFTEDTEWGDWDAPWETFETDEASERTSWTEYYESVKDLPPDLVRWKFEIECDGVHIGWVSRYFDLDYMENPENIPAIGIDIPRGEYRKNGNGTEALKQFIEYLRQNGFSSVYTQTWSGNYPMIRVAEKLGFKEVFRLKDHRTVNGKNYDAVTYKLEIKSDLH